MCYLFWAAPGCSLTLLLALHYESSNMFDFITALKKKMYLLLEHQEMSHWEHKQGLGKVTYIRHTYKYPHTLFFCVCLYEYFSLFQLPISRTGTIYDLYWDQFCSFYILVSTQDKNVLHCEQYDNILNICLCALVLIGSLFLKGSFLAPQAIFLAPLLYWMHSRMVSWKPGKLAAWVCVTRRCIVPNWGEPVIILQ